MKSNSLALTAIFLTAHLLADGCSTTSKSDRQRAPSSDSTATADTEIHLISTTDLHGYLQPQTNKSGITVGGLDVMAGYFAIARKADPETLILDSGDLFQGTIVSNRSEGAAVVRWMNYAGYTAAAIGNHDFDFGPGNGHNVPLKPGEDPLAALKAREQEAKFPFLSANICDVNEDAGKCADAASFHPASFVRPYLLKTVNGVKVGIIGLTTTSTPETTLPSNVASLRFLPLKSSLERYVPELKSQGAQVIVVALHEGGFCNQGNCNASDPLFKLIDDLSPEIRKQISVMLAGHTHSYVNKTYNGVRVLITGSYGKSFGYTTLVYHPSDSSVSVKSAQSVDFCAQVFADTKFCQQGSGQPIQPVFLGQPVEKVAAPVALIQKDLDAATAIASRVVGKLIAPVTKDLGTSPESTLGELMADAYRNCFSSKCNTPADIAFQNNGGIRSSSLPAGPVTYGQIFELMPFDNFHSDLKLKGSQVHDLLDAWFAYSSQKDLNIQVSGLQITYDPSLQQTRTITNSAGETQTLRDPIVSIQMADGSALDENRIYHVVMGDFLAIGGGGTGFVLKGVPAAIHREREERDEIVDYLLAHPEGLDYSKVPHRLILKNASNH